jgi:hypothetical protein
LAFCWIGLIGCVAVLVHGWRARCWKTALLSTLFSTAVGVLFTPWTSLREILSSNADVLLWQFHFRFMTTMWIMVCTVSLTSVPLLFLGSRHSLASFKPWAEAQRWFNRLRNVGRISPVRSRRSEVSSQHSRQQGDSSLLN